MNNGNLHLTFVGVATAIGLILYAIACLGVIFYGSHLQYLVTGCAVALYTLCIVLLSGIFFVYWKER